jgi:hypothetical protein
VALAGLLLTACAIQPPRPVELPLPARPTLTPLKAADLQCLSNSTYTTIVNRERGYKHWGLQLEAIIESNNAKATAIIPTH